MSEVALLPCPFCGGKAFTARDDTYPYSYEQWTVRCGRCLIGTSQARPKDDLIATWNSRVKFDPNARGFAELYGSHDSNNWEHVATAPVRKGRYHFELTDKSKPYRHWRVDHPIGALPDDE